jgi:hypothetical protein
MIISGFICETPFDIKLSLTLESMTAPAAFVLVSVLTLLFLVNEILLAEATFFGPRLLRRAARRRFFLGDFTAALTDSFGFLILEAVFNFFLFLVWVAKTLFLFFDAMLLTGIIDSFFAYWRYQKKLLYQAILLLRVYNQRTLARS